MDPTVLAPITGHGSLINSKYSRLYNNPMFDYLSEMLPQNIKDLFRWCELVYNSMPVIANGIRKLVNYPITGFSYEDDSKIIRDETKELVEKIHLKNMLIDLGTDRYVYGNAFRSIYFPFKRFLECKHCHQLTAIDNANFRVRKKDIELSCSCGWKAPAIIKDELSDSIDDIKIVRWDPKQLELIQNPITGKTRYYYALTRKFIDSVRRGDLAVLSDSPELFIRAALEGKNVFLGENFFHSRATTLSGYSSGWGISPLFPTLKTYMYISVLRKASEAIGMEHITPQRILFPQSTGSSDPSVMSSMKKWREEINFALDRWRMDPNYIMTAPYPTGVTNIGSQGRALSPTEEIKDARQEMALALDINPNILMGDVTVQASAVGLKILENQLTPVTESLQDFANWVIEMINAQFDKHYCKVSLVPFKLADDMMNKQLLMNLVGQGVSKSTILESFNMDADAERDKLMQEQLDEHDMQKSIESEIQRREQNDAAQAEADAQSMANGQIPPYNQQKMIAMAQEQAAQLMQVPYEERKSVLAQLQNEDYVMWALVSKQLEMFHADEKKGGGQQ